MRVEKLRVRKIGIPLYTLGEIVFLIKVVNVFKRNLHVINYVGIVDYWTDAFDRLTSISLKELVTVCASYKV